VRVARAFFSEADAASREKYASYQPPVARSRAGCAARGGRVLLPVALLALGACAAPVIPDSLARPANPDAPVPPPAYHSVTAGAATLRPVGPMNWREINRRVTPQKGPAT